MKTDFWEIQIPTEKTGRKTRQKRFDKHILAGNRSNPYASGISRRERRGRLDREYPEEGLEPFRRAFSKNDNGVWVYKNGCIDRNLLCRLLNARVGQPWDNVYAELCALGHKNGLFRRELDAYLEGLRLFEIPPPASADLPLQAYERLAWREFLVDPSTGILCRTSGVPKTKKTGPHREKARFKKEKEALKQKIRSGEIQKKKHHRKPKLLV